MVDALAEAEAAELLDHRFLGGIAATFGTEVVQCACLDVLGYPAGLVSTHAEASEVLSFLSLKGAEQ